MGLSLGPDFRRAWQGELYEARTGQPLWFAVLMVLLMFFVLSILQAVFGFLVMPFIPAEVAPASGTVTSLDAAGLSTTTFVKAMLVGLLPASLCGAAFAWWVGGFRNPNAGDPGGRGIPLKVPALGVAGWALVLVGLILVMWLVFVLTFAILGIDPATYAPSKDGLNDINSSAGMVEKVLADLSDEPLLFALALPGVTIAVPVVEEFIFRGALFSALRQSWFGKSGAVVITAAAWAVVHGMAAPWLFVFVIFVMGIVLGLLLLRFGSITVTIACHCVWNLFSSAIIFGSQASS